ncbi:hypothetical protein Sjap_019382 [Stephania japonica]|uniref:C2 domain-containing protein n=1 Tax=Stephania japonica TaxID=461633 RepID=A0AAP0F5X0_9MAGN
MALRGAAPPFQLLEINIISAQDLAPIVSRRMRSYAVAWVDPKRKLSTQVDTQNHANPTWNDKFVFRVDDNFLSDDDSAVMINIYAVRYFRDTLIGSVRVLVSNLIPPPATTTATTTTIPPIRNHTNLGTRFVALQIRRPSGRPQGILNIGIAVLDASMRSMPLYNLSAVGYRDIMRERPLTPNLHYEDTNPTLRRTQSDRTSNATDFDYPRKSGYGFAFDFLGGEKPPPLTTITTGTSSVWSESDVGPAPSVVAAAMAADLFPKTILEGRGGDEDDNNSLDKLKTKLEMWKAELPPVFDVKEGKSGRADGLGGNVKHRRRHSDGGGGLLSCFGDGYGCEVSISCGLRPGRKSARRGATNKDKVELLDTVYDDDDDDISEPYIIPPKEKMRR